MFWRKIAYMVNIYDVDHTHVLSGTYVSVSDVSRILDCTFGKRWQSLYHLFDSINLRGLQHGDKKSEKSTCGRIDNLTIIVTMVYISGQDNVKTHFNLLKGGKSHVQNS